ncbi:DNA repair protein RecO [Hyphobacterium sp. HN65]|uniref:DNA repair protein RecO n=1 Tax=Hyphobacterium lacteum TaxID=3116575 RepID=A0ABU7LMA7_9PROT|nr:DNA repair protein RecO [Hyphobacterium sp. HN65]MEE2525052.1 DNA repair protein RecO [Hyphobacterium sp. HN65]
MEWTGKGIVLAVRPHGETSAIVELLTEDHGRHAGLVKGGRSRSMRPVLQPGNSVTATWRARLADHLGNYAIEADSHRAGMVMENAMALAGLNAACALACQALPEREKHAAVYRGLEVLLDSMDDDEIWPAIYVRWEVGLLKDLGYGLDFSKCAATGDTEDLTHVSPRTGRAVSREAAAPYIDKLLPLPPFLRHPEAGYELGDIAKGLALTGFFLQRRVLWPIDRDLPESRVRLIRALTDAGRI